MTRISPTTGPDHRPEPKGGGRESAEDTRAGSGKPSNAGEFSHAANPAAEPCHHPECHHADHERIRELDAEHERVAKLWLETVHRTEKAEARVKELEEQLAHEHAVYELRREDSG